MQYVKNLGFELSELIIAHISVDFIKNLNFKVENPLNQEELTDYVKQLERIVHFPDSERYFNELYNTSVKILEEKGVTKKSLFSSRKVYYEDSIRNDQDSSEGSLTIIGHTPFFTHKLFIKYENNENYKVLFMGKERGRKGIKEVNLYTILTINPIVKARIMGKIFEMDPSELLIWSSSHPEQRKIQYVN